MKELNTIACGRTDKDTIQYCSNPDYSWRTNRVIFTSFDIYWHHGIRIAIGYEIYCKKCGHLREQGNHFDFSNIKSLITGNVYF